MNYKTKLVEERMALVHPMVVAIVMDADEYVHAKYGINLTIVESKTTKEEDARVGRKEACHSENPSRAVDIRTRDVKPEILADLKAYLLKKYGHLGAISRNGGKKCLIVDKPHGTGPHWHVQIMRGLPLE